jgi:hypothetical protein
MRSADVWRSCAWLSFILSAACAGRTNLSTTSTIDAWKSIASPRVIWKEDSLDIFFPVVALSRASCPGVPGQGSPSLDWSAVLHYPNSRWPNIHYTQIEAGFTLAPDAVLSEARLDSALAQMMPLTVDEMYSDVLVLLERTIPTKTWLRREPGSVHVHIEGTAGLREARRPQSMSMSLSWCDRNQPQGRASAVIPLR